MSIAERVALRVARIFPTEEALREYLREHPKADRSEHSVKKKDPRDYARERAQFAPPKKTAPFVGVPHLASRVAARFLAKASAH